MPRGRTPSWLRPAVAWLAVCWDLHQAIHMSTVLETPEYSLKVTLLEGSGR
jgi:hypothetical protein